MPKSLKEQHKFALFKGRFPRIVRSGIFFVNFHNAPYKKSYCIHVGNPEATSKALSHVIKGHVFNFLDDLTGGLVPFLSSYFFRSPASFTLAPTCETINRINRSRNYQGDEGLKLFLLHFFYMHVYGKLENVMAFLKTCILWRKGLFKFYCYTNFIQIRHDCLYVLRAE